LDHLHGAISAFPIHKGRGIYGYQVDIKRQYLRARLMMEVGGNSGRQHWEKAVIAGVVTLNIPLGNPGYRAAFLSP
jgi:hypothetical protein